MAPPPATLATWARHHQPSRQQMRVARSLCHTDLTKSIQASILLCGAQRVIRVSARQETCCALSLCWRLNEQHQSSSAAVATMASSHALVAGGGAGDGGGPLRLSIARRAARAARRVVAAGSCAGAGAAVASVQLGAKQSTTAALPELAYGYGYGHAPRRREKTPVTNALLGANFTVFAAQLATKGALVDKLAKVNSAVAAGQWYRLLTAGFCHAGLLHLLVNMYSLDSVGRGVEAALGKERYLQVYVSGAVAGNVASYFCSAAPAVGASGAIFGLVGAQMVFLKRNEKFLGRRRVEHAIRSMTGMIVLNAIIGLTNPRIDNWGHAGGFAGGSFATWLLGPKFEYHRRVMVDNPPINVVQDAWQRAIGTG